LWLDSPAQCPQSALGFDFDEAAFIHIGDKVTFEVLMASFGLEDDPALVKLAAMVHALDVGGATDHDASGFEAILSGVEPLVIVRAADTSRLDLTSQSAGVYAPSLGLSAAYTDDHEMLKHGMVHASASQ
jgi:hypothetical protein